MTVSGSMVSGLMTCRPPPTAKMAAWGELIMAVNSAMPNIPRLEMVKVPPCKKNKTKIKFIFDGVLKVGR